MCPSLLCRAVSCAVSNSDSISTAVASDLTHFLDSKDCLPENLLVCGYTAALAETQLVTAGVLVTLGLYCVVASSYYANGGTQGVIH